MRMLDGYGLAVFKNNERVRHVPDSFYGLLAKCREAFVSDAGLIPVFYVVFSLPDRTLWLRQRVLFSGMVYTGRGSLC